MIDLTYHLMSLLDNLTLLIKLTLDNLPSLPALDLSSIYTFILHLGIH